MPSTLNFSARLLCLMSLLLSPFSVSATMNQNELRVAGKVLASVPQLPDSVKVGIIYNEKSGTSAKEAERLQEMMVDGFETGRLTLQPTLIPIGQLRRLDAVDVAIVTDGMTAYYKTIAAATTARKVLSLSTDLNCVKSGYCLLGVEVRPRVNLLVNADQAAEIGVSFSDGMRIN